MDELSYSKVMLSKQRFNRALVFFFSFATLSTVVWAFLNPDSDSFLQKVFFVVVGLSSAFGLYLERKQFLLYPFPKDPTDESLIDYQIGNCEFNAKFIKVYAWGSLSPNYIGLIGIFSMEFIQGQFVIIFLFALLIILVFFLTRLFRMEEYYSDTYERITGKVLTTF